MADDAKDGMDCNLKKIDQVFQVFPVLLEEIVLYGLDLLFLREIT